MKMRLTRHAECRIRQRGIRERDVDLVLTHGTSTPDAVMLTNTDVAETIADCKRFISDLERLRGTAVFVEGEQVLSVYRPKRAKARRMIRGCGLSQSGGR